MAFRSSVGTVYVCSCRSSVRSSLPRGAVPLRGSDEAVGVTCVLAGERLHALAGADEGGSRLLVEQEQGTELALAVASR